MQMHYYWKDNDLYLRLHVNTNAKQNALVGGVGDRLKVSIKAPAVDGKANAELIRFLANHFGVNKSNVKIIKGLKSQDKLVFIHAPKEHDCLP